MKAGIAGAHTGGAVASATRGQADRPPCRMDRFAISRALAMRADGKSLRAIAVALKIPRATLARSLAATARQGAPGRA